MVPNPRVTFWGMTVQPGRRNLVIPRHYTLRITNVALVSMVDSSAFDSSVGRTSLSVIPHASVPGLAPVNDSRQEEKILLCTLIQQRIEQQSIDITISARENIAFDVNGNRAVALSGNLISIDAQEVGSPLQDNQSGSLASGDISSARERVPANTAVQSVKKRPYSEVTSVVALATSESIGSSDHEPLQKHPRLHSVTSPHRVRSKLVKPSDQGGAAVRAISPRIRPTPRFAGVPSALSVKVLGKRPRERSIELEYESEGSRSGCNGSPVTGLSATEVRRSPGLLHTPISSNSTVAESGAAGQLTEATRIPVAKGNDLRDTSKEIVGIMDNKVGEGRFSASRGDTITLWYKMQLANGTVVQSCMKDTPFKTILGHGMLLAAVEDGLVGMKIGGERLMKIPPSYGYGDQQYGSVPPNSALYFQCKLLSIERAP